MYTRCPNCLTIFRVTAVQLRLALGEVNCGSCQTKFNALNALSDELPELTDIVALEPIESQSPDTLPATAATTNAEAATKDTTDINPNNAPAQAEPPHEAGEQDESGPHNDWAARRRDADEDAFDTDPDTGSPPDQEAHATVDIDANEQKLPAGKEPDEAAGNGLEPGEPAGDGSGLEALASEVEAGHPDDDTTPHDEAVERRYDDTTAYDDEDDEDDDSADEQENENIDAVTPDDLEFNAPEQTWSKIFLPAETEQELTDYVETDHAGADADSEERQPDIHPLTPLESQTADADEWRSFLSELADENDVATAQDDAMQRLALAPDFDDDMPTDSGQDESSDLLELEDVVQPVDGRFAAAEAAPTPPWTIEQDDRTPRLHPSRGRRLVAASLLLVALGIQLAHQNRDQLAAHPVYGKFTRGLYATLGSTLYPDWSLDAFKVSGSEAVAGRTASSALDIHANLVIHGTEPVGQPMIRIVLRDRWANPVASRVFTPSQYLRDYATWPALLSPGTLLPVEISVADPGTQAQGYVVDVCLPRRTSGLQCQMQTNPFQK